MTKYIRYAATPTLVLFGIFFAMKGQYWMWVYQAIFTLIVIFGDLFLGDDRSQPEYAAPKLLNFFSILTYLYYSLFSLSPSGWQEVYPSPHGAHH